MSNRTLHSIDSALADCARQDARRVTPDFSQALHARVIQAVDRAEFPTLRFPPTARARRHRITPLSLAAAVAIVVLPMMLLRSEPGAPVVVDRLRVQRDLNAATEANKPQLAVLSTAHDVNLKVADVVQSAMAREQFAGLDHDVRAATEYLVEQVPLRSTWESAGAQGGQ